MDGRRVSLENLGAAENGQLSSNWISDVPEDLTSFHRREFSQVPSSQSGGATSHFAAPFQFSRGDELRDRSRLMNATFRETSGPNPNQGFVPVSVPFVPSPIHDQRQIHSFLPPGAVPVYQPVAVVPSRPVPVPASQAFRHPLPRPAAAPVMASSSVCVPSPSRDSSAPEDIQVGEEKWEAPFATDVAADQEATAGNTRETSVQCGEAAVAALIECKRLEWETFRQQSGRKSIGSADGKWNLIHDMMVERGVNIGADKLKSKWDRMIQQFKSVRDWNKKTGNESYWHLSKADKRKNRLPPKFEEHQFDLIAPWYKKRTTCKPPCISESMQSPAAIINEYVEEGLATETTVNGEADLDRTRKNLPIDASGISNSGVKRKKTKVKDGMVDAIGSLTSSLVEAKSRKDERALRGEQRDEIRDERTISRQKWREEIEERKISSAELRNGSLCSVLAVMAKAFTDIAGKFAGQ